MNEEFKETISSLVGYPIDADFKQILEEEGIKHSDVIALMQCRRLYRLADELSCISVHLSEIGKSLDSLDKNLGGCISVNGKNQYLCIAGEVTTY